MFDANEWVWDDDAKERWVAVKAALSARQLANEFARAERVRRMSTPIGRLLERWSYFCYEHESNDFLGIEHWVDLLRVRDQLEQLVRAPSGTPSPSVLLELQESDEQFINTTRHDDDDVVRSFERGGEARKGWWWSRRPIEGRI